MSEEDLSGHFHTYPKTYDRNVPKLSLHEFTRQNLCYHSAKGHVCLVQSKIEVDYSHDFEQKLFTSKKRSFHDASRLDQKSNMKCILRRDYCYHPIRLSRKQNYSRGSICS